MQAWWTDSHHVERVSSGVTMIVHLIRYHTRTRAKILVCILRTGDKYWRRDCCKGMQHAAKPVVASEMRVHLRLLFATLRACLAIDTTALSEVYRYQACKVPDTRYQRPSGIRFKLPLRFGERRTQAATRRLAAIITVTTKEAARLNALLRWHSPRLHFSGRLTWFGEKRWQS